MSDWNSWKHHRSTDPDTSVEAAASMTSKAPALKKRCLAVLTQFWDRGGTQTEIAGVLQVERGQVHKRLSDLKNDGLIADSGNRRVGAKGRKETVWVVWAVVR